MRGSLDRDFLTDIPWTNYYGLARSLIALGTLLTLLFNSTSILFKAGIGKQYLNYCDPLGISLYCLFDLDTAKVISIVILFLVISGWRPMITGVLHWWTVYSFVNSATLLDGGDHIASIITLLLLPTTLTDTRKSHWQPHPMASKSYRSNFQKIISVLAISSLIVIKIQISIIYLNAAVSKVSVPEWSDGSALYYWFSHPIFGYPEWLQFIIEPLIINRNAVFILTWGSILFEFFMFSGLMMNRKYKKYLMILGILFHFNILIVQGLVSFFFTMSGAIILYLGPMYSNLRVPRIIDTFEYGWHRILYFFRTSIFDRRSDS
jgi:antimicrobial peptide system SdpB family protein